MATEHYIFRGKAVYPMLVKPDNFHGVEFWKIGLKMDEPSAALYKRSGLSLKKRTFEDNEELSPYIVFRRNKIMKMKGKEIELDPPHIEGWDPSEVQLGNGSQVEITVEVYDTSYGNKGHRLMSVKAIDVVPFEGKSSQIVVHTPDEVGDTDSDKMSDDVPF